ncbi:MAG: type III pantothenate kinase, partial [Betaproteobacteria bacterium]
MILTVDIGNTQIKWAVFVSGKFSLFGRCPLSSVKKLPLYWKDLPNPEKIVVSNVAGEVAAEAIVAAITNWDINPYWVESQPLQCGVTNSYD